MSRLARFPSGRICRRNRQSIASSRGRESLPVRGRSRGAGRSKALESLPKDGRPGSRRVEDLAVATTTLYWQVREFSFVNFDDDIYILNNPAFRMMPGVTVTGTLTGPAADRGLPKAYTGITGANGTVKFTYTKKPLASGTYTFTTSLPCPFSQSIIR